MSKPALALIQKLLTSRLPEERLTSRHIASIGSNASLAPVWHPRARGGGPNLWNSFKKLRT
jgi:hypothetical protein